MEQQAKFLSMVACLYPGSVTPWFECETSASTSASCCLPASKHSFVGQELVSYIISHILMPMDSSQLDMALLLGI